MVVIRPGPVVSMGLPTNQPAARILPTFSGGYRFHEFEAPNSATNTLRTVQTGL